MTTNRAVVQMFAFKEPELTHTMSEVAALPTPDGWSVDYEAWVTPSCDDLDSCGTWLQAKMHPEFTENEAPQGKLSSRNVAHDTAVEEGYDVIIVWDADAPPLREDALKAILKPYDDGEVVAVNGNPISDNSLLGIVSNAIVRLRRTYTDYFHGQLSSFATDAWQSAGPFRTDDMDETDIHSVWAEEEHAFLDRLKDYGKVVRANDAQVLNDVRRFEKKLHEAALKDPTKHMDFDTNGTFYVEDDE